MKRSTDRILTTHAGRLPNPSNMEEIIAARTGDQGVRFGHPVDRGGHARIGRGGRYAFRSRRLPRYDPRAGQPGNWGKLTRIG